MCGKDAFLSPVLFNVYAELIIRKALEGDEEGVKIGERVVTSLRYADDTTILANTEAELKDRLKRIQFQSEKAGLHLNLGKTKVRNTAGVRVFTLGNDIIEMVRSFKFLGAVIADDVCVNQR